MDQLPVQSNNMNTMDWLPLHGTNHHYADNINRIANIVKERKTADNIYN